MMAAPCKTDSWAGHFAALEPVAPWLQNLRAAAFQRFSSLGFPDSRQEQWRESNVGPIARTMFSPAPVATADVDALAPFAQGLRLVFVNGRLVESPPRLLKGLHISPLTGDALSHLGRHASMRDHPFVALNTAFLGEAAYIRIAPNTAIELPIHLVYLTTSDARPVVTHPRALIVAGTNSQCTIVETYAGEGACFTNAVTEIVAGESSIVDHYKVQNESPLAFHIATLSAALEAKASYSTHSISLGGAFVRNETAATLSAASEATLNGLYLVNGTQHVENRVSIDHAQPGASSHQLYKGILDGQATAAFNGRILVRKEAQKTDARQTNKNLLLSSEAAVNTKPELQIYADDVRCTHGATIGQLDPDSMFYLRSRGLGTNEARGLLTYAFAQDAIGSMTVASVKDSLERILFGKFHVHAQ